MFTVRPGLLANDYSLVMEAIKCGAGIGLIPSFLANTHVASGELVRVLPTWSTEEGTVSLVWPATRHLAPRVRAFIDFMVAWFKTHGFEA